MSRERRARNFAERASVPSVEITCYGRTPEGVMPMTRAGVPVRAAVWDGDRLTVVDDLQVREPGPGEVSVDIEVAGLCHSDLNPILGLIEQATPVVLGHEAV